MKNAFSTFLTSMLVIRVPDANNKRCPRDNYKDVGNRVPIVGALATSGTVTEESEVAIF